MLPLIAARISSRVGLRVGGQQRRRGDDLARACRTRTAGRPRRGTPAGAGVSPSAEIPSIVTTLRPSTAPASTRHELTGHAVEQHRAGAAGALAAAELRAGQAEVVAQHARRAAASGRCRAGSARR